MHDDSAYLRWKSHVNITCNHSFMYDDSAYLRWKSYVNITCKHNFRHDASVYLRWKSHVNIICNHNFMYGYSAYLRSKSHVNITRNHNFMHNDSVYLHWSHWLLLNVIIIPLFDNYVESHMLISRAAIISCTLTRLAYVEITFEHSTFFAFKCSAICYFPFLKLYHRISQRNTQQAHPVGQL